MASIIHKDFYSQEEVEILVMRIATGKTNGLKILYGRCMRHKDVNLCAYGALAFYLMLRFNRTGEKINFQNASEWFDINLLVDVKKKCFEKKMSGGTYGESIGAACKACGVSTKKKKHFGRSTGHADGELKEMLGYYLEDIDHWNIDTRRKNYSQKFPMAGMRQMAGHPEEKGCYFVPRNGLIPPEELKEVRNIIFTYPHKK